jgi:cytochrome b6-f complex iron-sulfur subunit
VPVADPTRRQVVTVVTGTAALAALAGCGSGSSSSSSSAAAPAPGGVITPLSAVPVGSAVVAKDASGAPIVVSQPKAGTVVAFSAICTHMGCTVAPAGARFACPCHGSMYDAATGAVLKGPAPQPLAKVAVHVDGGNVVAG